MNFCVDCAILTSQDDRPKNPVRHAPSKVAADFTKYSFGANDEKENNLCTARSIGGGCRRGSVCAIQKHGCCCDYDAGDLEDDCDCCNCELDGDCPVEDLDNAEMPAVDVDDAETGEAAEAPAEDAPAEDADKSADKTEA